MNVDKYLDRIGFRDAEIKPDLECLKLLQRHHLKTVPFENLDIHWKRPIVLKLENFYEKIVEHKRGGFCYELNGLFNWLLTELGFKTKIISARVSSGKGSFGEEYDHLAILTKIDGEEFLTDVGFGSFITAPLKFKLNSLQKDNSGAYFLRKFDKEYFEVVKVSREKEEKSEYIFRDLERNLSDFAGMCQFHQSSKSHFSNGKVCSIMTQHGRKTLSDKKFSVVDSDKKLESEVGSEAEFYKILEREFAIKK